MSVAPRAGNGKVTVPDILSRKARSLAGHFETKQKITCLTAYDYPTARCSTKPAWTLFSWAIRSAWLVLGYESTLPVTLDEMVHHTRAVRRGTHRALLVADMPYGSFHVSLDESVRNAVRLVKEGGAEAVKVEGGERRIELIARLVEAEIPVMGHVGLTPQSIHALGGFHVQGKTADAARQLERDARAVEAAGAFAVVLESVPRDLAARITEKLHIPTIGIGAGPDCDGQVLVFHDLVGLTPGHKPKFARQYADLGRGSFARGHQLLRRCPPRRFPVGCGVVSLARAVARAAASAPAHLRRAVRRPAPAPNQSIGRASHERGRFSPALRLQFLGQPSHARCVRAADRRPIHARHGLQFSLRARHASARYARGVAVAGTLARALAEFLRACFAISKSGFRARALG